MTLEKGFDDASRCHEQVVYCWSQHTDYFSITFSGKMVQYEDYAIDWSSTVLMIRCTQHILFYGFVVLLNIWLSTTGIMREETCCQHFIGCSF